MATRVEVRSGESRAASDGVTLVWDVVQAAGCGARATTTTPLVALTPGGWGGRLEFRDVAAALVVRTGGALRVLLHDRRGVGGSGAGFGDGRTAHDLLQAADLAQLLGELAEPGVPCASAGKSSGARLSLLLAARHPGAVKAVAAVDVTGGDLAADFLAEAYYEDALRMANAGGMRAVVDGGYWAGFCASNPRGASALLGTPAETFVGCFTASASRFRDHKDPVVGVTREELASVTVPSLVVYTIGPHHDGMHTPEVANALADTLPNCVGRKVSSRAPVTSLEEFVEPLATFFTSTLL